MSIWAENLFETNSKSIYSLVNAKDFFKLAVSKIYVD